MFTIVEKLFLGERTMRSKYSFVIQGVDGTVVEVECLFLHWRKHPISDKLGRQYCLGQIEATWHEVMHPLPLSRDGPCPVIDWFRGVTAWPACFKVRQFVWLALSLQIQLRPDFSKTASCSAFSCSTFSLISFSWKCFLDQSLNQIPITELMHFPSPSFTGTRVQHNTKTPVMYAICENLPYKRFSYTSWISWWIHL